MSLGTPEILVCLLVALIVLGPEQLPKAARQLGKAIADFKKISASMQEQVHEMINVDLDDEKKPEGSTSAESDDADSIKRQPVPYTPSTEGFKFIDQPTAQSEQAPKVDTAEQQQSNDEGEASSANQHAGDAPPKPE